MVVPTYVQFMEPLLRFLAQHPDGIRARDVYDPVANVLNVSPEDRAQVLPSGQQQIYKNRIG
jgi:restriction system protein